MKLLFVISFAVFIHNVISFDYCDKSLCDHGEHIGCNNDGKIAAKCAGNSVLVESPKLKTAFVDLHNKWRNEIASGKKSKYKTAVRMATMTWDDQLAETATFNVKRCQMKHDSCRNTPDFKFAGQNLAFWWGQLGETSDEEIAAMAVNMWFDEWKFGSMDIMNKFTGLSRDPTKQYGHFTVMMADRNIKVGCAVLKTKLEQRTQYLCACNYATTNMIGFPIYKSGPVASECKTGTNPKYPALCSVKEQYDVNKWF